MLCFVFTSNWSRTVKVAPPSKSTGSANANTAAWSLPNCGSTAQPVFGLSSSDDAMESEALFCSKSATALVMATGFDSALPFGATLTRILLRAKLPLSARPGPPFVIEAWGRASSRSPVSRRCCVLKVKVYSSLAPFAPSAK